MDEHTPSELDSLRIDTQRDLQRMWELLMQPLGFRELSLWVTFVGPDRRPERLLVEVAESIGVPEPEEIANLCDILAEVLAEQLPGTTVALLITRPGRGGLTQVDRAFAARLLVGARLGGVPIEPVHVANDVGVWVVAPDDLAA